MTRQVINVGSAPNDGTGDGLRDAYIKCNENFEELYDTSLTPSFIANGTSNLAIATANGPMTFDIGGTTNVAVLSGSSFTTTANISTGTANIATGNIAITSELTVGTVGSDLIPDGDGTRELGSDGSRWANLWLTGSTLTLGNVVFKNTTGNTLDIFGADGTTPASLASDVIDTSIISNGVSNVKMATSGGNVTMSVGGVDDVLTVSAGGTDTTGTATITGNVTGGNIITAGLIDATGNIDGGNLNTDGNVSGAFIIGDGGFLSNVTVVSNVAVSQISNGTTVLSVTGSGGNLDATVGGSQIVLVTAAGTETTGTASVTGNLTAGNVSGTTGAFTTVTASGTVTATGNVDAGNVNITTDAVVTGNVGAAFFVGNGVGLFGISISEIESGTSNVFVDGSGGPVKTVVAGNVISNVSATGQAITGVMTATGNITGGNIAGTAGSFSTITGTLGTAAQTNITSVGTLTALTVTGTTTSGNLSTGGSATVTGNVDAGNVNVATGTADLNLITGNTITVGAISATDSTAASNVATGALKSSGGLGVAGNIYGGGLLSVTGNINGGNLTGAIVSGTTSVTAPSVYGTTDVQTNQIVHTGTDGVGNIGNSTNSFNTVFATATSAQYADVAEYYSSDADYEPGTVLDFGGTKEVTINSETCSNKIAGVVSSHPALIMNASASFAENSVAVALTGRVPTKVTGTISKGDMMVADGTGKAMACSAPTIGTVIGKALEDFDGDDGVIEVVVGRL